MRIAAAQLSPSAGDFERNLQKHRVLIDQAVAGGADLVLFPELSLTGYEPTLAKDLTLDLHARALDVLQELSDSHQLTICAGAPTSGHGGVRISMFVFQPGCPRIIYSKQQLHSDELPFFVPGTEQVLLRHGQQVLAPAICYESLRPEHAQRVAQAGAHVYLASVAKSVSGLEKAAGHYPHIARLHGLVLIMANSVGPCDNFVAAGQTSAWDRDGRLLGQLGNEAEGVLLTDTDSGNTTSLS